MSNTSDDKENWKDEDFAPVPVRVFQKAALRIDNEIIARMDPKRGPAIQLRPSPRAIGFGRRSLEVAIRAAVGARFVHPKRSDWEQNWIDLRDASNAADEAMRRLFRSIDRRSSRARYLVPFLRQSRLERTNLSIEQSYKRGRRDALILVGAQKIIARLAKDTERRRKKFVELHSSKIDLEKNAFVHHLAEAWLYLTGQMPGANPHASQNPFLRFVEAAWQDWQAPIEGDLPETPSFAAALKAAREEIGEYEQALIADHGPTWK